jgi:hypothetical protein
LFQARIKSLRRIIGVPTIWPSRQQHLNHS